MYAQLGDIKYEGLVGFQQFDTTEPENYAEHALIENKPSLQKIGSQLDTVAVSIRLHNMFTEPELELIKLRDHKKKGTVLTMIMGDGRIVGDFVILDMKTGFKELNPNGSILCCEVSLDLKEYYSPDKTAEAKNQAVENGFANTQNNPPQYTPEASTQVPSMEGSESLVSANANMQGAAGLANTLDVNSTILKTTCQQMLVQVQTGVTDLQKLITIIDADAASELYDNTRDLSASAASLVTQMTGLVGDIQTLITNIDSNPGMVAANIVSVGQDVADCIDQLNIVKADATEMAAMAALKK